MTANLLTALRSYCVRPGETVHEGSPAYLMTQAADEIERLRGEAMPTTDTTAPAADLREAILGIVSGAMDSAIPEPWEVSAHAADNILALFAPRLAAAREEGRREGIEQAAEVAERYAIDSRAFGDVPADPFEAVSHASRDITTAIRALADAPRTAEREGG